MDKSSITAREWHVRKALPEDLPMIAEIEKLSFHRPWSFDSIESFYYRKTSDIYVWRDRNRISGYIIAEHVLDQAELHRIAMIPFYSQYLLSDCRYHQRMDLKNMDAEQSIIRIRSRMRS